MRFWPHKKWKKIVLTIFLVFLIAGAITLAYVGFKMNSDVSSEIAILNPGGSATALVIYHPGITSLMKDVAYAFAGGLVSNGWRVEITTPSSEAPNDLSGYNLLVLGSPVYGFSVTPTIGRFLDRSGDLNKIDTVVLLTAAGAPANSALTMEQAVLESNGSVKKTLVLFGLAPNEGDASAIDLAEQAGKEILP